jgi:prefoldin subunit 5
MDNLRLNLKELPKLNNNATYCMDAKTFNALVDHVQAQTDMINKMIKGYNQTIELLTETLQILNKAQHTDRELVLKVTKYLKEGV